MKFIILIPLFNDWKSVSKLLNEIDFQIKNWNTEVSIFIVNDASTEERFGVDSSFKNIKLIKILNMKQNRASSRCIAAGLKYICNNEDFDRVIVMDADGEDRPEELADFFKKSQENSNMTITGNRFKRSEGLFFKLMYEVHKFLTLILTGKSIKFGNFTCLPKTHVQELIQKPYLWNSYSSSIIKTIKDRTFIPSVRGLRYVFPSKVNFFGLVYHSLSIISVFIKLVVVRSIIFSLIYLFFIYERISIFTLFPILFLIFFIFFIFIISKRANMEELNKSSENIGSVDILRSSNNRQ